MQEEAIQRYRATILSDGALVLHGRTAYFSIALSDNKSEYAQRDPIPIKDLLEFLRYLALDTLEPLGLVLCSGHPKIKPHTTKSKSGEWLPGVILTTRNSELNTELYHEYYPDGKKIIPEDFTLTSIFLAWFFMFDGNSSWHGDGGPSVGVHLCTEGFDLNSVTLFEEQLCKLGLNTGQKLDKRVNKSAGIGITVHADSTDHFMDIVDPYVVFPYRYKVKYRGSCPPELAENYKKHRSEGKEDRNKRYKEWIEEDKEHYDKSRREYYQKNREYFNERQRKRRRKRQSEQETTSLLAKVQSIRSMLGKTG